MKRSGSRNRFDGNKDIRRLKRELDSREHRGWPTDDDDDDDLDTDAPRRLA